MSPKDFEDERYKFQLRAGTEISETITKENSVFLTVNDLVAIPVFKTNKFFVEKKSYGISIFSDGEEVGELCLMSVISLYQSSLSSLTSYQYAAYLALASQNEFISGGLPTFSVDCLIIKKTKFNNYWVNRGTSALWGGFSQIQGSIHIGIRGVSTENLIIKIDNGCTVRTQRHQKCLEMAAKSVHPTERFLHFYHYLELDYDYELLKEIKGVSEDNPSELWDLLKSQKLELDRLNYLFRNFVEVSDIEFFATKLRDCEPSAKRIFYDYGKEGNPLDFDAFKAQIIDAVNITRSELHEIKKLNQLSDNFAKNDSDYLKKMIKLACYWIYRVRCCIAHNKIGEYHLNETDDIDLLNVFSEPLLIKMIQYRMR